MVAKYGNIIPLMETQINGICCKVSMNGLYNYDSSKCLEDTEEHI